MEIMSKTMKIKKVVTNQNYPRTRRFKTLLQTWQTDLLEKNPYVPQHTVDLII